MLLEKGPVLLQEERDQARKVSHRIKGFGSIDNIDRGSDYFRKGNSHYKHCDEEEDVLQEEVIDRSGSEYSYSSINGSKEEDWEDESKPLILRDKERLKFEFYREDRLPFNNVGHQSTKFKLLLTQS